MKVYRYTIIIILSLLITCSTFYYIFADSIKDKINQNNNKINKEQSKIDDLDNQIKNSTTRIAQLTQQSEQLVEQYNKENINLQNINDSINNTKRDINNLVDSNRVYQNNINALIRKTSQTSINPYYVTLFYAVIHGKIFHTDFSKYLHNNATHNNTLIAVGMHNITKSKNLESQLLKNQTKQKNSLKKINDMSNKLKSDTDNQNKQIADINKQKDDALKEVASLHHVSLALAEEQEYKKIYNVPNIPPKSTNHSTTSSKDQKDNSNPIVSTGKHNIDAVINFAKSKIGLPYVFGSSGPSTYDCSGLTMEAWLAGGVHLPRIASDQYKSTQHINLDDLQPGDLVFWSSSGNPNSIYHVALYVGNNSIIEAPRTGEYVKQASLYIMGTPSFYGRV